MSDADPNGILFCVLAKLAKNYTERGIWFGLTIEIDEFMID